MFDFTDIVKNSMPTHEELVQRSKEIYVENLNTPENFTLWFPHLKEAMDKTDTDYKYPKSSALTLSYDWMTWLQSDDYTKEKTEEFSNFLKDTFELEEGKTYFMKTGVFSNKFNFVDAKVEDINNVGKQFLDIFYTSMIFGADSTNEIVIREYIEPVEDVPHIYNGMPLRTEYRVFADLKGEDSEIIGVVNYWHPQEMRKMHTDMPRLWDIDKESLEENLITFKKVHNRKNINSFANEIDIITYRLNEELMVKTFNENKDSVAENIEKIIKNIDAEQLSGEWSIDVMQNGEDFYVIDAARKDSSALNEYL